MLPLLILLGTYIVLAIGQPPLFRIDRAGAAVIGAILMVAFGGLPFDEAARAVDYRTLVLLFGMMVLVAHLQMATFFRSAARLVAAHVRHPAALVAAITVAAGVLSALFVNDTVCLMFTPIVIEVAALRGLSPLPLLLGVATGANIGSVATITGNPQNMLIGSLSGIGYARFAGALAPVALVGLALNAALICLLFRRDLSGAAAPPRPARIRPLHRRLMVKPLLVAAAMLVGFLAGVEPALVAAGGAAALLVTRRIKPEKVWKRVDWDLLMLFVGLFIVIGGIEHAGLDRQLFEWLRPLGLETMHGLTAIATLLSNVISNVPAVMLLSRFVPELPSPETAWLTLAMSSTLAGNLTLLGSIANLIVLEGARRRGVTITFGQYLRVGLPVTLLTLAFGVWWL
ncbi:MAG TPA: anion transporter [Vicinamibacterales bacterium]